MHRFYYPDALDVGEFELAGAEAHHLVRVLRLNSGDRVEVFDGKGQAVCAEIVATAKRMARLRPLDLPAPPSLLKPSIRLLSAAPKADRLRWLVEKATELGVSRLSLLQTHNSVVHPGASRIDKLNATVLASCKQCGRNDLMPIDPPRPWQQVVDELSVSSTNSYIAVPGYPGWGSKLESIRSSTDMTIAIGPEGDWEASEVARATERGMEAIGLGPRILRVETAAIAAVSAVRVICSDRQ